jgi:hypothetical protein
MSGPGVPWIATSAVVSLLIGVPRRRDITSWSGRARQLAALFVLLAHFLKRGAARDAGRKLWPA